MTVSPHVLDFGKVKVVADARALPANVNPARPGAVFDRAQGFVSDNPAARVGLAGHVYVLGMMRRDSRDRRKGRPVQEDTPAAMAARDAAVRARLAREEAKLAKVAEAARTMQTNPNHPQGHAARVAQEQEIIGLARRGFDAEQIVTETGSTMFRVTQVLRRAGLAPPEETVSEDVRAEIARRFLREGEAAADIAAQFGIHKNSVYRIAARFRVEAL